MTTAMQEETRHLVARAQNGDRAAFDLLVQKHRVRLTSLIHSRRQALGAAGLDPEDIVQESLLRAFQAIERFQWRGEDSFMPWLAGIVERVILHLRRQSTRRRASPLEGDVIDEELSTSRAMRRSERFDRLEEALKALSPDHRQVITMARIEGLKIVEIAARMNRSPNAVMQLLWRAMEKLKANFGDTESLHLPDRDLLNRGGHEYDVD